MDIDTFNLLLTVAVCGLLPIATTVLIAVISTRAKIRSAQRMLESSDRWLRASPPKHVRTVACVAGLCVTGALVIASLAILRPTIIRSPLAMGVGVLLLFAGSVAGMMLNRYYMGRD